MRNLKKILALVMALVMSLSLVTIANAADFTDNDDISYEEAADVMNAIGVIEGYEDGSFDPNGTLVREEAATLVTRMLLGSNASNLGIESSSFDDVDASMYYAEPIAWASSNGIVTGYDETTFGPNDAITREQMAAILCRYADYKGHDTSVSYDYLATFGDSGSSHVYARPALNWAVAHRIINGQGSSVLAPRATATRAEVAQVLMNYLEAYD